MLTLMQIPSRVSTAIVIESDSIMSLYDYVAACYCLMGIITDLLNLHVPAIYPSYLATALLEEDWGCAGMRLYPKHADHSLSAIMVQAGESLAGQVAWSSVRWAPRGRGVPHRVHVAAAGG